MIVRPKPGGKWVTEVSPDDSVAAAACRTLKPRLKSVRKFLSLASSSWQQDPEYVHQLRVHSRRCLAAVEMYASILPKRRQRRMQRWLRQILDAAGQARNMDVLLMQYGQPDEVVWPDHLREGFEADLLAKTRRSIVADLEHRRFRAQRPIDRLNRNLIESNRFKRATKRLVKGANTSRRGLNQPFARWAPQRFHQTIDGFLEAVPRPRDPVEKWHRFRVRGKQLRYTMELVSFLYDSEFRSSLYVHMSRLQEQLGELSDHTTAHGYLTSLRDRLTEVTQAEVLDTLIERESERMNVALVQLQSQWASDADSELVSLLRRYGHVSVSA
jgi:CHAD domain-containing protein